MSRKSVTESRLSRGGYPLSIGCGNCCGVFVPDHECYLCECYDSCFDSCYESPPNNKTNHIAASIITKGDGPLYREKTKGTLGNCRGRNATDLQVTRRSSSQVASGDHSGILAGCNNTASGDHATVVGGTNNLASCERSAVINGCGNTASGGHSFVVNGQNNTAKGCKSFILNGDDQSVDGFQSFISNGTTNVVTATNSHVHNGTSNNVSNNNSFIDNGNHNSVASINSQILNGSTNVITNAANNSWIGNGQNNSITKSYSTILNGTNNVVTGNYATALGGDNLSLITDYSTAVGKYNNPGTFTGSVVGQRLFMVGGGSSVSRSNLVSVLDNGYTIFQNGQLTDSGADIAEWFETEGDKLCAGTVVALKSNGIIKKAEPGDKPIGVVSDSAAFVSNGAEEAWRNKYERDETGGIVMETIEVEKKVPITKTREINKTRLVREKNCYREVIETVTVEEPEYEFIPIIDSEGNRTDYIKEPKYHTIRVKERIQKVSSEFDHTKTYIPRSQRPSWHIIGFLGRLRINENEQIRDGWIKISENINGKTMYFVYPYC